MVRQSRTGPSIATEIRVSQLVIVAGVCVCVYGWTGSHIFLHFVSLRLWHDIHLMKGIEKVSDNYQLLLKGFPKLVCVWVHVHLIFVNVFVSVCRSFIASIHPFCIPSRVLYVCRCVY